MSEFPYTAEQREKIEKAIDALSPKADRRAWALKCAFSAGNEERVPDWSAAAAYREDLTGRVEEVIRILESMARDSGLPIAGDASAALGPLQNIGKWLNGWSRRSRDAAEFQEDEKRAVPGPNYKPFRDGLFQQTAYAWRSAGGTVNGEKAFCDFFDAVVRPVLNDKTVQEKHRIAWSPNIFRSFIKHWNSIYGIDAARGRPKKNAALAEKSEP